MNERWRRVAEFMGHLIAGTVCIGFWLIIVTFILRCLWFILFRLF